jgi:multiple sugar transport system substrate-binding protein
MPKTRSGLRAERLWASRRTLGLAAVTAVGVLSFAACSSGASNTGTPGSASSAGKTIQPAVAKGAITLTEYDYYTAGYEAAAIEAAISAFEKKYPNVKIVRQTAPYPAVSKLVTLEAAGNTPNIVIDDQDYLAQYYAGLVPMTTFFPQSFINRYLPGGTESATLNGHEYGLQVLGGNDTGLIYNKTDFAQAGIKAPPATWAQLLTDAAKLTDPKANRYGFAVSGSQQEGSTWQLEPFVWSDGGTLSNPDATPWHQAMGLWSQMVQAGDMPKAVTGWEQTDEESHFLTGNVAMQLNGPWEIPQLSQSKIQWGVAPYPTQSSGQTLSVPIGGEAWSIGKSTTEKEAASAAFVQFLTNDTALNLELTHDMGYLPALKNEDSSYATQYPEYAVFANEFKNGKARIYGQNYLKISSDIQVMIGNVLSGSQSVGQALQTLQGQVSAIPG